MALIFSSDSTIYSEELGKWIVRATYYQVDATGLATPMPPMKVPVSSTTKAGILEALKAFGVLLEASISPDVLAMQTAGEGGTIQKYMLNGAEV